MPYTAANAPDHVKKLPDKKRRQWLHIFNGCISDGKPESKCFKMANGVAAKEVAELDEEDMSLVIEAKSYQYVDSYEYAEKRLAQSQANYNSVGGDNSKACANCQWFISPSRCAVVDGEISPTGVSDLWRPQVAYVPPPIPVVVVGSEIKSTEPIVDGTQTRAAGGLLEKLRSLIGGGNGQRSANLPVRDVRPFSIIKQKDGRTRFYTVWSNNFMDREGEIFTKAAHKEFVQWTDDTKSYPELWLWHTYGTKFGQVDWLDATDDGFVHASGLIDVGKEAIAEKASQEDSGVSHGFWGYQTKNVIHWYRSYELSVLPASNAAVWTTSFNILEGGAKEMAFTEDKRKYLQNLGCTEEQIKEWEGKTAGMADALKALGVESKTLDDLGVATAPDPTPEQKAEVDFRVETTKTLMGIQEVLSGLASQVKSIDERTKDIKSGDAVVAAAMAPPNGAPGAVQASKSNDNVVSPGEGGTPDNNAATDFFKNTVLGPLIGTTPQV